MKRVLTAIIAVLLFSACEKGTRITYRVVNNSGAQITFLSYYNWGGQRTQSSVVNTGDTRDILIMGNEKGGFEKDYYAGKYLDSIIGTTNNNKVVVKDLTAKSTWVKTTNGKQGRHVFTTEILPKDIQ